MINDILQIPNNEVRNVRMKLNIDNGYTDPLEEYKSNPDKINADWFLWHNTKRLMGRTYESLMNELEILEILPAAYDGDEFPGYENVRLSYSQLSTIILRKRSGWIATLKNQKAVYLITDKKTGKLYVGSATAQYGMLLQRWLSYVDNGYGGKILCVHEHMDIMQIENSYYGV